VLVLVAWLLLESVAAFAHDISQADRAAVAQIEGPAPGAFLYLGAKHMVTGIDHILFLIGVVFFLYRLRDVVIYVTMFTIGHSLTLMGGRAARHRRQLVHRRRDHRLLGGLQGVREPRRIQKLGIAINTKLAVLGFGLFHGLGLATKVRDLGLSDDGLLVNLISFNVGVEIGQVLVLTVVVTVFNLWRATRSFAPGAFYANLALMAGGFLLMGYQLTGYFTS
jgi:hypothetical protein